MLGAVDMPAGGIWIAYIKQVLRAGQLVAAVPVTGSLVCFSWLNVRNTTETVSFPWRQTLGDTDRVNRAEFQVWLQAIAGDCNMDDTAGPPVAATTGRRDELGPTPRPPGPRRRQQGQTRDTPARITPRLTEQDPRMAAGAVVFDCRPALLPVSVDVSGIDMLAFRSMIPPAKSFVIPPNLEQQFGGGGGGFA